MSQLCMNSCVSENYLEIFILAPFSSIMLQEKGKNAVGFWITWRGEVSHLQT